MQDKAGGNGYNRDLIGAAQALDYRYGAGRFHYKSAECDAQSLLDPECMNQSAAAFDAAGDRDKEVPSRCRARNQFFSHSCYFPC